MTELFRSQHSELPKVEGIEPLASGGLCGVDVEGVIHCPSDPTVYRTRLNHLPVFSRI